MSSNNTINLVFIRSMASAAASISAKSPIPLSTLPATSMRAWAVQAYKMPLVQTEIPVPSLKRDDHVLLRVMASSINPIDLRICEGYGREMLPLQAKMGLNEGGIPDPRRVVAALTTSLDTNERFPLVPGRDCSAEVVEVGSRVQGIEIGDQVIAVIPPEWQGCHADYVAAPSYALAPKPTALKHIEAASLPYAACTAWSALVKVAQIQPDNAKGIRALIHGGAGGVGSIAVQMLKSWGADRVVATCSKEKVELVEQLGAKGVDYQSLDAKEQLIQNGPYELILDCATGSELADWSDQCLGKWRNCLHITLNSDLLADTDRYGLPMGLASFGAKLACKNLAGPIRQGQLHVPAFFSPSSECLQWITHAAQEGRIHAIIDQIFPFSKLPEAFEKVGKLHGRGKTVVDFSQ